MWSSTTISTAPWRELAEIVEELRQKTPCPVPERQATGATERSVDLTGRACYLAALQKYQSSATQVKSGFSGVKPQTFLPTSLNCERRLRLPDVGHLLGEVVLVVVEASAATRTVLVSLMSCVGRGRRSTSRSSSRLRLAKISSPVG